MNNRYKNTGVLFELLVRHLIKESTSDQDTPQHARRLLRKYFRNSPIKEEKGLYDSLTHRDEDIDSEKLAEEVLTRCLLHRQSLDNKALKVQKYKLVGEIKSCYGLNEFFSFPLPKEFYRLQGKIFHLFEGKKNPVLDVKAKKGIVEHIASPNPESQMISEELRDFMNSDKSVREMALLRMVNLFNQKFKDLPQAQRRILEAYTHSNKEGSSLSQVMKEQLDHIIPQMKNSHFGDDNQALTESVKRDQVVSLLESIREKDHFTDSDVQKVLLAQEYIA